MQDAIVCCTTIGSLTRTRAESRGEAAGPGAAAHVSYIVYSPEAVFQTHRAAGLVVCLSSATLLLKFAASSLVHRSARNQSSRKE